MVDITNIIAEENRNGLSDFEKMVAKWLTYDYYCPSIKAEVIWDMLLSEFIPDILAYATSQMENATTPASSENLFYILAKEFPIKKKRTKDTETKESLLSPKADYLVAYNGNIKKIFIVELKTTLASEDSEQLDNYLNSNVKDMFEHYKNIITSTVNDSSYDKEPLKWESSKKYVSQITYMYNQFITKSGEQAEVNVNARGEKADEVNADFIERLSKCYGDENRPEIYYLYVMREKDSCEFSIRVQDKRSDNKNKEVVIYRSGSVNNLSNKLKADSERGKKEINKYEAWKRLTVMLDAISNYKKDFNDKKKYLVKADK
jgi:hypothetical protein